MADTIPQPPEAALALAGDKRWELVQRIASSTPFKKSPRLRQFLLFVAERNVSGHTADISEYEIGWKVFERGQNYNPMDDSIVRSAARQLRAKVKEYFETEGSGEAMIVDIPKGGYVPVFLEREQLPAVPVSAPSAPLQPDPSLELDLQRWKRLAAALAAGLVALAGFAIWKGILVRPAAPRGETIVSTVLSGRDPTRVVLGDFGLAYIAAATKHPLSVAEYANRSYPAILNGKELDPPLQQIWNGLKSGQMASVYEASIAGAILRLSGEEKRPAILQHSRQLTAQDFRTGNMIVIASPVASPWIHLLEDKLNFRYKIRYEETFAGEPEFQNIHPRPGEKDSYPAAASVPQFGTSYAILARVPNLSGTGKILIIYGFKASGAQAVGEYATDPRAAAELARVFGVGHVSQLPDFEVLLSNETVASTPLHIRVVAHRTIQ